MKKRICSIFMVFTFAMVPVLTISPPASAEKVPKTIRLSAGAMGQSLYMLLSIMSRWLPDKVPGLSKVSVIAGGAKANPKLVDNGTVDIATTSHPIYRNAIKGERPYKKKYTDLRILANAQGFGAFYFMVRKETGLTSVRKDFIEKKYPLKIGTFLRSGPPELNTRRLLREYGVSYDDVRKWGGSVSFAQWGDIVNLYRDGHINAIVGNTSLPSHFHEEAAKARPTKMLPLEKDMIDTMIKKYGYLPVTIPKGTYGIVKKDMPTFGYFYMVFTHKRLPNVIAYEVVKQMAAHADDVRTVHSTFKTFDHRNMAKNLKGFGKIHPGAERFYRQKGWMN
jgi:TRAP transporter TAXI family solute receptor